MTGCHQFGAEKKSCFGFGETLSKFLQEKHNFE